MQIHDHAATADILSSEEVLFDIPLRKEYVLSQIGRGKRVLDVGCLGGKFSRLILENHNEVWGVEINGSAAEAARRRGVRVKVANVEEGLPFEDSSFDVIHAGEVVEHLYDTKLFFMECWRVLKDEGFALFTVPNLNCLENRLKVMTGGYLSMAGAYPEDHFGEHVRVFNQAKVQELCSQTGFKIDEIRGVPTLASQGKWLDAPLALAGRFLPGLSKLLMVKATKIRSS